ncbi:hypothetical protein FOB64_000555 [Candida albicans]|uniref:Uncharacterized protein n=1 Tax=Candida albicans TaxID=5476 RepID=A0A8H6F783_CANAX|nr:hypothetical protein FOB64_000555 [Candida albicans]
MSLKLVPQQRGIVHTYGFNLTAFEFTTDPSNISPNIILFVGGLGNGLLNIPYLPELADSASNEFQSTDGWGTSSLDRDTSELQSAIDISVQNVVVQGGILQAPVSDSEALSEREWILPQEYRKLTWGVPTSAYRFYSLASKRGDDDYFSSYLTQEDYTKSFGKVNKPLLVLYGSIDEFVPEYVDKENLVSTWKQSTSSQYWSEHSQIIKGATHNLGDGSDAGVIEHLVSVVKKFISDL